MIATLTAPTTAPGIVPPLRWTVEEFHRLGETGFFEGRRPILLRGVILEQGMMKAPHAGAILLATEVVRGFMPAGYVLRTQLPLVLSLDTDPIPDLAIVTGSVREAGSSHPKSALFVLEVSDTTIDTDLTVKAELYATARITDYWVLDLAKRQLHVLRDPVPLPAGLGATAYRNHKTYGPEDSVSPLAFPGQAIRVGDLLP
jgi:Uma2 family endonuclease